MKKFTIGFLLLLVMATGAALGFVGMSPEFVEPGRLGNQENVSPDSPVWDKTLDELAAYLLEKGVLSSQKYTKLSEGIATEARNYDGIELYWWDLESLEEGSAEYTAYMSACEEGVIDLWGSGILMNVTAVRGPFAINIASDYVGDAGAVEKAFRSYCSET